MSLNLLHEEIQEMGGKVACDICHHGDGWLNFTGRTLTNTPKGSKMVYFVYKCKACGHEVSFCSKQRS